MIRAELQQLAEDRILDAQTLLTDGRWSGAYYLVGYAVECGLKSCVLAHVLSTAARVIYQERRFLERCWTHNLEELVKLAALENIRNADGAANPLLATSWLLVKDWSEKSRYEQKTQSDAEKLFNAVNDPINGVMPWIRARW